MGWLSRITRVGNGASPPAEVDAPEAVTSDPSVVWKDYKLETSHDGRFYETDINMDGQKLRLRFGQINQGGQRLLYVEFPELQFNPQAALPQNVAEYTATSIVESPAARRRFFADDDYANRLWDFTVDFGGHAFFLLPFGMFAVDPDDIEHSLSRVAGTIEDMIAYGYFVHNEWRGSYDNRQSKLALTPDQIAIIFLRTLITYEDEFGLNLTRQKSHRQIADGIGDFSPGEALEEADLKVHARGDVFWAVVDCQGRQVSIQIIASQRHTYRIRFIDGDVENYGKQNGSAMKGEYVETPVIGECAVPVEFWMHAVKENWSIVGSPSYRHTHRLSLEAASTALQWLSSMLEIMTVDQLTAKIFEVSDRFSTQRDRMILVNKTNGMYNS